MAPRRLYELPHEQLCRLLAESKREGLSFDAAWDRAVRPGRRMVLMTMRDAPEGCVRWPTDSGERVAWRDAILYVKDAVRRAYQDRPMTRREEAVLKVGVVIDAADRRDRTRGIDAAVAVRSAA